MAGVLVAGVAVGLLWSALSPWTRTLRGPEEAMAAGDATLGLLGVLAGIVTTLVLFRRPGTNPSLRLAVVLVASTVGAFLAWPVGRLCGAPVLHAVGVLLLWPLTVALLNLARSVVGLLIHGD